MKNSIRSLAIITLTFIGFAFRQKHKQSFRRRMAATPGSTPQKGKTPFCSSPPALPTQQLVGFRSKASPPAASIPALALAPLCSTAAIRIRPTALQRSC
jgi:hypothetical protein